MSQKLLVVAAGLPPEIGERFVASTSKFFPIISWFPLARSKPYCDAYATDLYLRLAAKLRPRKKSSRHHLSTRSSLILVYLDKCDGSESTLLSKFGMEAFLSPLQAPSIAESPLATGNQKGQAVNNLKKETMRAIQHARLILSVISEEITNRDSKTCLLLPQQNFGAGVKQVFSCVHDAASARVEVGDFKKRLKFTSGKIPTISHGGRKFFVGRQQLVFKSPTKAAARHGLPSWESPGHSASCVIRGRLRFGATFDPKFHYDCQIPKGISRTFPSCHATKKVKSKRKHVNIAPNDNIR